MDSTAMALPNEHAMVALATDEPSAFAPIYDHYFSQIYNYIRYRVTDAATTDDLTAVVFEKALHSLHRYHADKAPFGAWLFSIARNTVSDHLRANRRRKWLSLDFVAERPADGLSPEMAAIQNESHQRLLAAVQQLDDRERDVIALKFGASMTNRHIATVMGISESNVGVVVYRAIRKLRGILGGMNDDD